MSRAATIKLLLTHRALHDIQEIFDYSVDRWGKRVAEKYLDGIEAGLDLVKVRPELLRSEPRFSESLQFYRIEGHLLVCDVRLPSIVVLTVVHASVDIPAKLADLQSRLSDEVEILHRRLRPE